MRKNQAGVTWWHGGNRHRVAEGVSFTTRACYNLRSQQDASDFISFILVIHRDLDVFIAHTIVYDSFSYSLTKQEGRVLIIVRYEIRHERV